MAVAIEQPFDVSLVNLRDRKLSGLRAPENSIELEC